ncbi:hypothetical protein ACROYT_G019034 [Oculina patagonica]
MLKRVKCCELKKSGITNPSDEDMFRRITKKELATNCRRKTHGVQEMTRLIYDLLETFQRKQGRTSASDMHFQAYLLEGLSRWNADHASDAVLPNLSFEENDETIPSVDAVLATKTDSVDTTVSLLNMKATSGSSDLSLTNEQEARIIELWNKLEPYDKRPTNFSLRHHTKVTGQFKLPKKRDNIVVQGVESTKRCFLGNNAGPV